MGFVGQLQLTGCAAQEIEERDALIYEKAQILELTPQLNKTHMTVTPKPWTVQLLPDHKDTEAWCSTIGTREMAARVLVAKGRHALKRYGIDFKMLSSKLENYPYG